jgi:hypothetical protein
VDQDADGKADAYWRFDATGALVENRETWEDASGFVGFITGKSTHPVTGFLTVFVDTDGDGHADQVLEYAPGGVLISEAQITPASDDGGIAIDQETEQPVSTPTPVPTPTPTTTPTPSPTATPAPTATPMPTPT